MIVCLVFVFASLIEYAVVNVIARRPSLVRQSAGGGADDVRQAAPVSTGVQDGAMADRSAATRNRWKRVVRSSGTATSDTPLQQATHLHYYDSK